VGFLPLELLPKLLNIVCDALANLPIRIWKPYDCQSTLFRKPAVIRVECLAESAIQLSQPRDFLINRIKITISVLGRMWAQAKFYMSVWTESREAFNTAAWTLTRGSLDLGGVCSECEVSEPQKEIDMTAPCRVCNNIDLW
jgi:hypothetical protein